MLVHPDSDDNQEFGYPITDDPYPTEDGGSLSASFDYTFEESADAGSDADDGGDSDSGLPGFGVSVALVALLAAGFLLYRRD